MLITIIVVSIILSYFIFKGCNIRKLKAYEAVIIAIIYIGITAYFILFIVRGV